jgi:mannitol repressor
MPHTTLPTEAIEPVLGSLNRFQALVRKQDERGLVLSLAAFAEDTLGVLLVTYLQEGKQSRELVEGFNAPLGTLSTRIKACYAMGLLTRDQYDDLDICRRIRNEFAHDWEGISLFRDDIKALIGQLHGYTVDQRPIKGGPKDLLLESITTILLELRVQVGQHRKHHRRAPTIAFRLTTKSPR